MGLRTVVTIRQVADEAGVSIQTVSRVINNRYDVAVVTRKRVQDAIDRLGYKPNAIARGLASRRSRTLGIVIHDITDSFFTHVLAGAEEETRRQGYILMLGNSRCAPEEEPAYLRLLTERHVEGVLLCRQPNASPANEPLEELAQAGIPLVMTSYKDPRFNEVDIDNIGGGRAATEYLLRHGHRRIATITGPIHTFAPGERLEGYRQALAAAGVAYDPALVAEGSYDYRSGYQAMQRLLRSGVSFTALFSQNDRMAAGAMLALRESGLRTPEDVSVVGYDDIPEAEFSGPPLTTMRQPMLEVGRKAIDLLVRHIEQPDLPPEQVYLPTELIERLSVRSLVERRCEGEEEAPDFVQT